MGYFDAVPLNTMIGSLVPILKADWSTSSVSTPSAVSPANVAPIWPIIDWAFSPVWAPTRDYLYLYLDLGSVKSFDTVLWSMTNSYVSGSTIIPYVSSSASSSYTSGGSAQIIAGPCSPPYSVGPGVNCVHYATPVTARYLKFSITSGNGSYIQMPEIALANTIELQHNELLSSFTRTPGVINEQSLTMQNGRQVKIITGKATDRIHASYTWSDNGTLSRKLYTLFNEIASSGCPMLWIPPIKDRTQEDVSARIAELINLESIPEVVQSSATTWKMEFSGRCQP